MKLSNREILELAGLVSIVLSLIFVGYQLVLDRRIALADSYTFAMEARKEDLRIRLESDAVLAAEASIWEEQGPPDWWRYYLRQVTSPVLTDPMEILAFAYGHEITLLELDSIFYRCDLEFLSEPYCDGAEQVLYDQINSDPLFRAVSTRYVGVLQARLQNLLLNSEASGHIEQTNNRR